MCEDHKKQLNILGEIREELKRIADQGEPTRIIFAKKPAPDDALVEAVKKVIDNSKPHKHEMAYFVIWKDYIAELEHALDAHKKAVTK